MKSSGSYMRSSGNKVVRVLASHQYVPGLILRPGVMCGLSLLLVLSLKLAPKGFSPGIVIQLFVHLKSQQFDLESLEGQSTGCQGQDCKQCISATLVKQS